MFLLERFIDSSCSITITAVDSVDARNPAPPEMYKTLQIMTYLPHELVQDFFHPQYCYMT